MSGLYAVLRERIPEVASSPRTAVSRERLQAAQSSVGLSNERLAALIPVSEKTWRRWKQAGEIPTHTLPRVAQVLGLELREAPAVTELLADPGETAVPRGELREGLEQLLEGQQEMLVRQQRILGLLEGLAAGRDEHVSRQPNRRAK